MFDCFLAKVEEKTKKFVTGNVNFFLTSTVPSGLVISSAEISSRMWSALGSELIVFFSSPIEARRCAAGYPPIAWHSMIWTSPDLTFTSESELKTPENVTRAGTATST